MAGRAIRFFSARSLRFAWVVTWIALSGCSTIHLMPPRDLVRGAAALDTVAVNPPVTGHWHRFRGYRDQWGEDHWVEGRVRTLPPDSLELRLFTASWSMNRVSGASIVSRDSIRFLRIVEPDSQGGGVVLGIVVGAAIAYVAVLATIGHAFGRLGRVLPR